MKPACRAGQPIRRREGWLAGALIGMIASSGVAWAAEPEPVFTPPPGKSQALPPPPSGAAPPAGPNKSAAAPEPDDLPPVPPIVPEGETYPINLPSAIQLAERVNPRLNSARAFVSEQLAVYRGSRVLLLPNLNAGTNYHQHNGVLQTSFGLMRNLTEQSIYVGGGARALAAETVAIPMLQISTHLGEVFFLPLAARQEAAAANANASATENDVLLAVATGLTRLQGAEAKLVAWNVSRVQMHMIVRSTGAFARIGQGREGDYRRAQSQALLLQADQQGAQADVYLASNELARLLRLDPAVRLTTGGSSIELLDLVDPDSRLDDLVNVALAQRPELSAQSAQIGAANDRYRLERTRPLFPYLMVGFSGGAFGGGSDQTALGVDSFYQRLSTRDDFDVSAIWTLQNFGMGNIATARQRRAERDTLIGGQAVIAAAVRRQVIAAHSEMQAQRRRIDTNARQLASAEQGAKEEINRTRAGESLPIESLNSVTLAAEARQNAIDAVVGYNIAQLRLFVALGGNPYRMPSAQPPQVRSAMAPTPPDQIVPLPEVLQGNLPRNPLENPVR